MSCPKRQQIFRVGLDHFFNCSGPVIHIRLSVLTATGNLVYLSCCCSTALSGPLVSIKSGAGSPLTVSRHLLHQSLHCWTWVLDEEGHLKLGPLNIVLPAI